LFALGNEAGEFRQIVNRLSLSILDDAIVRQRRDETRLRILNSCVLSKGSSLRSFELASLVASDAGLGLLSCASAGPIEIDTVAKWAAKPIAAQETRFFGIINSLDFA
jgi:hypothetical protein